MIEVINKLVNEFLNLPKQKPIRIISHYDTDGITAAAILAKTFQRLDRKFTIRIVKGLDESIIKSELEKQETHIIFFSDLGSSNLEHFNALTHPIFILDHHEINKELLNDKIKIANPHLTSNPKDNECTGAGVCYLFAKAISQANKNLSHLAIIGMIGDRYETNISKINQQIISDCPDLTIQKGLILYPATRPLKRTLEYSTSPYIPGVTGQPNGVLQLLRETGISGDKTLLELNSNELSKLITSILLRKPKHQETETILGNLYILKFFNTKEDVREISTLINACSRLEFHDVALLYCMENEKAKQLSIDIYTKYKQELVSGLRTIENMEKEQGHGFVILNAHDKIKDAIIGTICSMLSSSPAYEEGTILIGMAYNKDKIKVSARIVGREGRNLKEIMEKIVVEFKQNNPDTKAEVGGHHFAAGCLVEKQKETEFLKILKQNLEIEYNS